MGGSRGGGGTGGPDPPWNCQIINFCHVEIFRQTPSGNLDPHPEKIFWIRAWTPSQASGNNLYDYLSKSDCFMHCTKDYSRASSESLISYSIENRFSSLNGVNASPVQDFSPLTTSTPTRNKTKKAYKVNTSIKVAHINFLSIREKETPVLFFCYNQPTRYHCRY